MQNSWHCARLSGWSRLQRHATRHLLHESVSVRGKENVSQPSLVHDLKWSPIVSSCTFNVQRIDIELLHWPNFSQFYISFHVSILPTPKYPQMYVCKVADCHSKWFTIVIAVLLFCQYSHFEDTHCAPWLNCPTIFKSMCLVEVSALRYSIRGWGLPLNYLHLGMYYITMLYVRVWLSALVRVGGSGVWWKLLGFCVILWSATASRKDCNP